MERISAWASVLRPWATLTRMRKCSRYRRRWACWVTLFHSHLQGQRVKMSMIVRKSFKSWRFTLVRLLMWCRQAVLVLPIRSTITSFWHSSCCHWSEHHQIASLARWRTWSEHTWTLCQPTIWAQSSTGIRKRWIKSTQRSSEATTVRHVITTRQYIKRSHSIQSRHIWNTVKRHLSAKKSSCGPSAQSLREVSSSTTKMSSRWVTQMLSLWSCLSLTCWTTVSVQTASASLTMTKWRTKVSSHYAHCDLLRKMSSSRSVMGQNWQTLTWFRSMVSWRERIQICSSWWPCHTMSMRPLLLKKLI